MTSEEAASSTPAARRPRIRVSGPELVLRVLAAAGLGYDAFSHFDLAVDYDGVVGSGISQGTLFRIESVLAILAAVAVLLVRRRIVTFGAFLLAAGGVGAVLLYRFVNVGEFGPFPNMFEPVWYTEKALSATAMAVAALALLILLLRRPDVAPRSAT